MIVYNMIYDGLRNIIWYIYIHKYKMVYTTVDGRNPAPVDR